MHQEKGLSQALTVYIRSLESVVNSKLRDTSQRGQIHLLSGTLQNVRYMTANTVRER